MKALKKRILPGVMAGVLALTMAVPAFAASTASPAPNTKTEITGTYTEIPIAVRVAPTGEALINPYGVPVALTGSDDKIVGQQISTKPLFVINEGDVALYVSAAVTTAVNSGSDLRLTTEKPSAEDTSKSAFVYLQMAPTELTDADKVSSGNTVDPAKGNKVYAEWEQDYDEDADLVLQNDKEVKKENMVRIEKSTVVTGQNASITWSKGSVAMYRLAGQVTAEPREAWVATDGFKANVAFTFKPDTTSVSYKITDKDGEAVEITHDPGMPPISEARDYLAITKDTTSAGDNAVTVEAIMKGSTIKSVKWEITGNDSAKFTKSESTAGGKYTITISVASTETASQMNPLSAHLKCTVTAENDSEYTFEFDIDCEG